MSYETVEYSVAENIGWIRLNRPDNGNALNEQMALDLMDVAWKCAHDDNVRVVVLTSNGKAFSFGGDLNSFVAQGENLAQHLKDVTVSLHEAIIRFVKMKKPVLVAVNGTAAGAGMSLSMMGDFVIATKNSKFTMAYTNIGLTPDGSGSYFLPRIVGARRAIELTLTDRILSADEAQDWGIVNKVVSEENFSSEVEQLANQLAAGPIHAYGEAKSLIYNSFDETLESQLSNESSSIAKMITQPEAKEGIAAFLEKRKPNFKDV